MIYDTNEYKLIDLLFRMTAERDAAQNTIKMLHEQIMAMQASKQSDSADAP